MDIENLAEEKLNEEIKKHTWFAGGVKEKFRQGFVLGYQLGVESQEQRIINLQEKQLGQEYANSIGFHFEKWVKDNGYTLWYRQEPLYLKDGEDYSTKDLLAKFLTENTRKHEPNI